MSGRSAELQQFVSAIDGALRQRIGPADAPAPVVERLLAALSEPGDLGDGGAMDSPPVLEHLPRALAAAADPEAPVSEVGQALQAIAPGLDWRRRPGSEAVGGGFYDGHANATVIGHGGLEERSDIIVGLSLLAPGVRYPDHNHPPEEVYLVLSPGEWWQAGRAWHEPGIGGIVHNPPGIMHAMRAGEAPLLAVWLLWMEG